MKYRKAFCATTSGVYCQGECIGLADARRQGDYQGPVFCQLPFDLWIDFEKDGRPCAEPDCSMCTVFEEIGLEAE